MNPKQFIRNEDAVSPVIGVILMVAITVILAAVIASFVLGLGGTDEPAPTPTLEWSTESDGTDDFVVIDVTGGDSFDADNVEIEGQDINVTDGDLADAGGVSAGDTVEAGTTIILEVTGAADEWEVELYWNPTDSDRELLTSESA